MATIGSMSEEKTKAYIKTMSMGRSSAFNRLSKEKQEGLIRQEFLQEVHKQKTDPKYKKEVKANIKKIKKRALLRKLKKKGHITHGSKYGKLKSGLSINGKNR